MSGDNPNRLAQLGALHVLCRQRDRLTDMAGAPPDLREAELHAAKLIDDAVETLAKAAGLPTEREAITVERMKAEMVEHRGEPEAEPEQPEQPAPEPTLHHGLFGALPHEYAAERLTLELTELRARERWHAAGATRSDAEVHEMTHAQRHRERNADAYDRAIAASERYATAAERQATAWEHIARVIEAKA